ncbi:hypothetical protein DESHY_110238 [Desulforamulus hydrothermalis Lam5 = DSM 18033]|uniref:Uncharacterized protein n=1 Tax=Desulforamulus hydrothermalis Lam5 = DSM 18033 TaxID=1121428 RepID=K8DXI2_9FIRM|nr:hypothetical protein DESHY_110238 [Desulforamulus hydrothermalis Lam5 = DSM 18033]
MGNNLEKPAEALRREVPISSQTIASIKNKKPTVIPPKFRFSNYTQNIQQTIH